MLLNYVFIHSNVYIETLLLDGVEATFPLASCSHVGDAGVQDTGHQYGALAYEIPQDKGT